MSNNTISMMNMSTNNMKSSGGNSNSMNYNKINTEKKDMAEKQLLDAIQQNEQVYFANKQTNSNKSTCASSNMQSNASKLKLY